MNCPNFGDETQGYVCKPPKDTPHEGVVGKYNQAANDFGEGCCESKTGPPTVVGGPPWLCCRFVPKTDINYNRTSNSRAVLCQGILRFDTLNIIHLMVE